MVSVFTPNEIPYYDSMRDYEKYVIIRKDIFQFIPKEERKIFLSEKEFLLKKGVFNTLTPNGAKNDFFFFQKKKKKQFHFLKY